MSIQFLSSLFSVAQSRRSIAPKLLLVAILLASNAPTASAQSPLGEPSMSLWDEGQRIGSTLAVGTILQVGLDQVTPNQSYVFELLDEGDSLIAGREVLADQLGKVAPVELWRDVVGCDDDTLAAPTLLRFRRHDEAASGLEGRRLTLIARDLSTEITVASTQLVFDIHQVVPRFFSADVTGCARHRMPAGEALYLGGYHVQTMAQVRLFVAPHQESWQVGDTILEVREEQLGEPQAIRFDAGAESILALAWTSIQPGAYDLIVRPGESMEPIMGLPDTVARQSRGEGNGTGSGLMSEPCWDCGDEEEDEEESEEGAGW